MAPDGQGRWDCPTNVCTILTEGFQGREGPPGTPFPPPSPHEKEAPTCSTNFSWRWRLWRAPGWEEMEHPPWPRMEGGIFLVRGTWPLLSGFLVLWVSKATGLLSPPRWGSEGWSRGRSWKVYILHQAVAPTLMRSRVRGLQKITSSSGHKISQSSPHLGIPGLQGLLHRASGVFHQLPGPQHHHLGK